VTLVPFRANVFSTPAYVLLIAFQFMRHRHQILCPCWLTPAFAPLITSLRYLDVNNVGITYLAMMLLRSTRLTAHHVPTLSIGQPASWHSWRHTVSAFVRMSTPICTCEASCSWAWRSLRRFLSYSLQKPRGHRCLVTRVSGTLRSRFPNMPELPI
jgi:hypothetical protein